MEPFGVQGTGEQRNHGFYARKEKKIINPNTSWELPRGSSCRTYLKHRKFAGVLCKTGRGPGGAGTKKNVRTVVVDDT
jgi:hypothetical protein